MVMFALLVKKGETHVSCPFSLVEKGSKMQQVLINYPNATLPQMQPRSWLGKVAGHCDAG